MSVREKIAEIEHEQWMKWAQSMLDDPSVQLSDERIARWKTCMIPYAELSEEMKDHDRVWADKVLAVETGKKIHGKCNVDSKHIETCEKIRGFRPSQCANCDEWTPARPATIGDLK